MNRDDLLKRCVDRRVAHETSVVAVSHLFYVYLLSALKKGQRVEVPNFGTFGTHVVGVKRQRRMPYFEVENELAEKVNERYRSLKAMLVGKVEFTPADGEVEYGGTVPPFDSRSNELGREVVLDTYSEISPEQMGPKAQPPAPSRGDERVSMPKREPKLMPASPQDEQAMPQETQAAETQAVVPSKEKKLMPKLNLRGDEPGSDESMAHEQEQQQVPEPPPTLRDLGDDTGPSPLRQIIFVIIFLALVTVLLNYFGVVRFWGDKSTPATTEETLPPAQPQPQVQDEIKSPESSLETTPSTGETEPAVEQPQEQPTPATQQPPASVEQQPSPSQPTPQTPALAGVPAGTGTFTIQISSWPSRSRATTVVNRLASQGFDAYIVEGLVKGKTWYRVRVGRYASAAEAQAAADKISENGVWVTKID